MLVVASDRVSAFDHVLSPGIPGKGVLLTTLSLWWFDQLAGADGGRASRTISRRRSPDARAGWRAAPPTSRLIPAAVPGAPWSSRASRCCPSSASSAATSPAPAGPSTVASGTVCGIPLPDGLNERRPAARAALHPRLQGAAGRARREHLVRADRRTRRSGARGGAARPVARDLRARGRAPPRSAALILADTKFEFGIDEQGVLTLADEVLTSDSSRYWDAEAWRTGTTPEERMASFDKQIVRDWLAANWDKTGHAARAARRDRRAHRRPLPRAARAAHRLSAERPRADPLAVVAPADSQVS